MGRWYGGYELLERVGAGGMGEVWRGKHRLLGRPAAIKVIKPSALSKDSGDKAEWLLRRFEREARATSFLKSPHTIQLYDFGIADDGTFYYAMEFLEGCTLQAVVEHSGPMRAERVISILSQAAESLAEAHHNGLVHRDIKPGNIFLCQFGLKYDFVKVLDFGLVKLLPQSGTDVSKLTADNVAQGTPAFIPPEVVNGTSTFDARSDIYALGCVAYWLLTGELVFDGASAIEVVLAHVNKDPVPPSERSELPISKELDALILQCLAKDPQARPQSAIQLRRSLSACPVREPWTEDRAERWWRTHQPQLWAESEPGVAMLSEVDPISSLGVPDKPSIVVLPFQNMNKDPEQDYFSDGITEDLITDLSKLSGMFVIARNSSFCYKGKAVNIPDVCRELGVRYALEGSIRRAGNRVRITAQLVDGRGGGHLWAERYDRELTDIFAVQDEVTEQIVAAVGVKLSPEEASRASSRGTSNLEAYEYFLRVREQRRRHTAEGTAEARRLADQALRLDPSFGRVYAMLARISITDFLNKWNDAPVDALDRALELADKAVAFAPKDSETNAAKAMAHMWRREHGEAERALAIAGALDPNLSDVYAVRTLCFHYQGRSAEGLEQIDKAMRLDPNYGSMLLHMSAQCRFSLGEHEKASEDCLRRIIRQPDSDLSRVLLAACYAKLGRVDEAREYWRQALELNPKFSLEYKMKVLPYTDSSEYQKVIDALALAQLP